VTFATHVLLASAAGAFALRSALGAPADGAGDLALVVDALLVVVVVAGTESTAIGMIPIGALDGHAVRRWSPWAWGTLWALGLVAFVAVVVHPDVGLWEDAEARGVVGLFVAFGALTALACWGLPRLRRRTPPAGGPDDGFPVVPPPPPAEPDDDPVVVPEVVLADPVPVGAVA
jgi:hypothetical protein